ncbi:MAG TPA: threonine/serine exporter family protein [Bryobacteraceae bacterium]|nr:threonine/serine exporter family protein [Bryobacteraceae bacterium]
MDLPTMLMNSLWAALFAAGLGILLTAPHRYLVPTFFCGFAGRLVRDLLVDRGLSQNWSTMVAAAVVVLVAAAIIRRHQVSPVVLVCGVLPLGAAVAMFNTIVGLMKLSSAQGDLVGGSSIAFTSNLAKVFMINLAVAGGIGAGVVIVRILTREEETVGV